MKKIFFVSACLILLAVVWFQLSDRVKPVVLQDDEISEDEAAQVREPAAAAATSTPALPPRSREEAVRFEKREKALEHLQKFSTRKWDVRRDGFTDSVRTLQDGELPKMMPEAFIAQYSKELFGVPAGQLVETRREVTDRTKVVFEQKVDGLDVYGGTLTLFYENDNLTRIQNDLAENQARAARPTPLTSAELIAFLQRSAMQSSQALGENSPPSLKSPAANDKAKMIFYPGSSGLVHAYQLAVQESRAGQKPDVYWAIVDAEELRMIAKKPYFFK